MRIFLSIYLIKNKTEKKNYLLEHSSKDVRKYRIKSPLYSTISGVQISNFMN